MSERIFVCGLAMVTPVGLNARHTYHSTRCGINRFAQCDFALRHGERVVMAKVPEQCLPERVDPFSTPTEPMAERLARLLYATFEQVDTWPVQDSPLFLGLPAAEEGKAVDGDSVEGELLRLGRAVRVSEWVSCGRAAGLVALKRACVALHEGRLSAAVIGGVDSFAHADVLSQLESQARLKSERMQSGFIPGEAAALVLLATETQIRRMRWSPIAGISGCAVAEDSAHFYNGQPRLAVGLSKTLRDLFQQSDQEQVAEVFSGMNGEPWWSREWGVASMRNRDCIGERVVVSHPADCFGDLGAAVGPVLLGLAALGQSQRNGATLITASSDTGTCAACTIRS